MSRKKSQTIMHIVHFDRLPTKIEENGHNLDICVLRRLRLTQRQMQEFLGLKLGGGGWSSFANMGLNRAHETERTVFWPQVFSMCRRRL